MCCTRAAAACPACVPPDIPPRPTWPPARSGAGSPAGKTPGTPPRPPGPASRGSPWFFRVRPPVRPGRRPPAPSACGTALPCSSSAPDIPAAARPGTAPAAPPRSRPSSAHIRPTAAQHAPRTRSPRVPPRCMRRRVSKPSAPPFPSPHSKPAPHAAARSIFPARWAGGKILRFGT